MSANTKTIEMNDVAEHTGENVKIICEETCGLPDGEVVLYQLTETYVAPELYDGTPETAVSYSVTLTIISKDEKGQPEIIETSSAYDISRTYEEAISFFNTIHRGTVTPATLEDIVDDWLGEWDF